jgi:hypothetical protein
MNSPRAGKAASVSSSAGTNVSASLSFLPRYTPKPEPSYISPTAANEHINHLRDQDQFDPRSPSGSPTNDGSFFGEQALSLLNTFLDALLYNFLTKGHGTSLSQLRPAITEVLKAKLARDALASADEELHGLIGESDTDIGTEEELTASSFGGRSGWAQDWHLELAFKRMRLRVMVFIRLGDFDDEDEDRFLEDDEQFRVNDQQASKDMEFLASPAAVYLASVLEHIAEQALTVAGEAAFARSRKQLNKRINEDEELSNGEQETVVVEEMDVEKIALNPTLGRLWRTWRKNYRLMHGGAMPGPPSPPASPGGHHRSRLGSLNEIARSPSPTRGVGEVLHLPDRQLTPDEIPDGDVSETDIAANIPLPMSENDVDEIEILGVAIPLPMSDNDVDEIEIIGVAIPLPMGANDVDEIEVPGLAKGFDEEDEEGRTEADEDNYPPRPSSAVFFLSPTLTPDGLFLTRPRSRSIPTPVTLPFQHSQASDVEVTSPVPVEDSHESHVVDESKPFKVARASVYHDAVSHPGSDVEDDSYEPVLETMEEKAEGKEVVEEMSTAVVKEAPELMAEEVKAKNGKDKSPQSGVVAGAVAGAVAAAALVGTAFVSMAGIGHGQPEPTGDSNEHATSIEEHAAPIISNEAKKEIEAPSTANDAREHNPDSVEESVNGITTKHHESPSNELAGPSKVPDMSRRMLGEDLSPKLVNGLAAHPIVDLEEAAVHSKVPAPSQKQVAEDRSTKSVMVPKVDAQDRSMSQLQAPLEDSDLKAPSAITTQESKQEKKAVPTGNAKLRETQALLRESAATADAQVMSHLSPMSQVENDRPISTISTSSMSEKELVPAPLQMSNHDRTVLEELNGHNADMDGIGVAKTSNVPIHSHSPSPPPDQQRSYYLPGSRPGSRPSSSQGSPKHNPFQGRMEPPPRESSRNANSNRDRSLVGADEYILARNSSASKRNPALSPLKQVTKASETPHLNGDTPHAVPFYHSPVDDDVLKQGHASKRASKEEGPKVPPLQTSFAESQTHAGAVRPSSSSQSTGGRSTSSTPTGHSAKGSASSSIMPRSLDKRPSDESKRRDFDSLLKNEETVKYTLTPEDLREAEVIFLFPPHCPSLLGLTYVLQNFRPPSSHNRNSGLAAGERSPRIVSSPSSASKRSPPRETPSSVSQSPKKPSSPLVATFTQKPQSPKKVVPRVSEIRNSLPPKPLTSRPEPMNTNTRKSGFMPREPRVMTDDTRDFADFVRSTRPTSEQPLLPLIGSAPSDNTARPTNDFAVQPPARPESSQQAPRSSSRLNMVPREPDIKGGGSSELIDFIRQGPPAVHANGQHRIPRNVAPFRSTMDSDDLSSLGNFDNFTTSSAHNSMTSSSRAPTTSSNSNLLPSQNVPSSQRASQSNLSAPPPQIVRKTRRVKDPYAIDSDDEDDLLTALPTGRQRRAPDESLEEFLRNTEPPSTNAPTPVRAVGSSASNPRPQTNGHVASSSINGRATNGSQTNSARPRSRSNTITSQTSVAPPVRAAAPSINAASSRPPVMQKKFEARAAGATRNGFGGTGFHYSMNDMADFLRSSGPPESGAPSPDVPLSKKPSKRGKKFWQRA